jgi:hypothetical protein
VYANTLVGVAIATDIIICGRKGKKPPIKTFFQFVKHVYINSPLTTNFNSMSKFNRFVRLLLFAIVAAIIFYIWNRGWSIDYNFK